MKLSYVIIYLMQTWEGMFLKNPSRKTIKVLNTEEFLSGLFLRTTPGITAVNQLLLIKDQINTFGTKESHDNVKKLLTKNCTLWIVYIPCQWWLCRMPGGQGHEF